MKSSSSVSVAAFILVAHISSFCFAPLPQSTTSKDSVLDRTFSQRFNALAIENLAGRIEVQTWNSNRIRVIVSRAPDSTDWKPLASRIRFQSSSSDTLRMTVRSTAIHGPIDLSVFVPHQTNLSIKGGAYAVVISGATSALSVETETGAISLRMSQSCDTDLSLRAIKGTITSKLQMTIFGPVDAHSLDGRIGQGGAPVIARSAHGAIELLLDDASRLARADAQMTQDRGPTSEPTIVKSSRLVASNDASDRTTDGPDFESTAPDGSKAANTSGPATGGANQVDPAVVDVVKIDTRLVNLNVRVVGPSGKLITDLSKEDFQVFENDKEQEVTRFEPVTSPVNVVLLLDLSGSTKDHWKVIRKAAKKFIDILSPNTPIGVAGFTRKFLLISDFTLDRKLLKDRLDNTKNRQSGTAFYDATWSALDLFKELQDRRKAIVVMSDGVDNSLSSDEYEPRHPFDELLTRMIQDDVTIYPIYFDTEFEVTVKRSGQDTHESYVTARKQLQRIAEETGGTLFQADRSEDLEGVYQRVAAELQTLYSVSYNPADKNYDGKWRSVGVKVKRAEASVRTKRGFYAK